MALVTITIEDEGEGEKQQARMRTVYEPDANLAEPDELTHAQIIGLAFGEFVQQFMGGQLIRMIGRENEGDDPKDIPIISGPIDPNKF